MCRLDVVPSALELRAGKGLLPSRALYPDDLRAIARDLRLLDQTADFGTKEQAKNMIAALLKSDFLFLLVSNLARFDFESQKDVGRIFAAVCCHAEFLGLLDELNGYIVGHPSLLDVLVQGCGEPAISMHCADVLRALGRQPALAAHLWQRSIAGELVRLVQHEDFEISIDALATLKHLLFQHKAIAGTFIAAAFSEFFGGVHELLENGGYVIRRQVLKLLGGLLLDTDFGSVMVRYVCSPRFLKIQMDLLRDSAATIRLDAFHIFKAFVANPRKPPRIRQILQRNASRLVSHLQTAMPVNPGEQALLQDLSEVIAMLRAL